MTISEFKTKLDSVGIPVAYRKFPKTEIVSLPFIVYYEEGAHNFPADGESYYTIKDMAVDLYTKNKDVEIEGELEKALSFCVWNKTETYLEGEQCYIIAYTMEV